MTAVLAIGGLIGLGGCSASSVSVEHDDPYASEFESARASTDDPTLLKILQDDEITDAEYAQVQQLEVDCDAEYGLKAWPHENGDGGMTIQDTTNLPQEQFDKITQGCTSSFTRIIDPLYWGVRQNPDHRDPAAVILECLKKFHVVDGSMTVDQFKDADYSNPPWDKMNGDAYGCETRMAAYTGGEPDLTSEDLANWPKGFFG